MGILSLKNVHILIYLYEFIIISPYRCATEYHLILNLEQYIYRRNRVLFFYLNVALYTQIETRILPR